MFQISLDFKGWCNKKYDMVGEFFKVLVHCTHVLTLYLHCVTAINNVLLMVHRHLQCTEKNGTEEKKQAENDK